MIPSTVGGLDDRRGRGGEPRAQRRTEQRRAAQATCGQASPTARCPCRVTTDPAILRFSPAAPWRPPTPDRAPAPSAPAARAPADVLQPQVGVGQRDVRGGGVAAPDRDLQRVDRFARAAGAQMDAADQQVRLRLVGRQEDRAAQLRHRLAILLALEEPAAALEMELRQVALVALRGVGDRLVDAAAARSTSRSCRTRSRPRGSGSRCRRSLGLRVARARAAPRARARARPRRCCPRRRARARARRARRRRRDCAAAPRAASRSPPADRDRARRRSRD